MAFGFAPCRQLTLYALLAFTSVIAAGLWGQQSAPKSATVGSNGSDSGDQDYKISTAVEMVLLDVSVKKRDGGWARGLKKEDFRIFEAGQEQKISHFGDEDLPVTVGLVIDNSGSVRPKRAHIVTAALALVQQSHSSDEFFIVNFNDSVRPGLPAGVDFSTEVNVLRQALLGNPAQGRTALYDGIASALRHLEKGRSERKMLVVIADGGDNASTTSRQALFEAVARSSATIYTIGIFNPDDPDKNPGFLKKLANMSGGEAYTPETIDELRPMCEGIAADIRHRYSLGYIPQNRHFDNKIRKLRLHAQSGDGRELKCRSRTSYMAVAQTN